METNVRGEGKSDNELLAGVLQTDSGTAAAVAAGVALRPVRTIALTGIAGGARHVAVHKDFRLEALQHEPPTGPAERRATVTVRDVASFLGYVRRTAGDGEGQPSVLVAADIAAQGGPVIRAFLNYHDAGAAGAPRWGDHTVTLSLRRSRAWETWKAADGKAKPQEEFARFVEDNAIDIREPAAAVALDLATSLQVHGSVSFEKATRLQDGRGSLRYVDNTSASAGAKGDIPVPQHFVLGLVPFEGGDPVEVIARLRYRIAGSALSMWVDLLRPQVIEDAAFADVLDKVRAGLPGVTFLNGSIADLPKRPE